MRFKNKVCIVTGGTSGIGRATAVRMGAEGGKVLIVGRNEKEAADVITEITGNGGEAQFAKTDIENTEEITLAVNQAIKAWGKVDVLVNDAAMMTFTPIVDLAVEDWEKVMNVNLRAMFLFCKLCIPHMNGGAIVNVSSVHAHQTTPNVVPYATSKGGIEAFTRGLSLEHPITKLRINAVAPGAVDTPMLWDNPNVKSGKEKVDGVIGKPEDIAAAICFLAADEACFINGTTLVADGGRLNIL